MAATLKGIQAETFAVPTLIFKGVQAETKPVPVLSFKGIQAEIMPPSGFAQIIKKKR